MTRTVAPNDSYGVDDIPRLAEALMRQAADVCVPADGVLLDLEINGLRCTIVLATRPPRPRAPNKLSPREAEIARMVAEGYSNKVIAAVLDISTWTVNTYLRRIFVKLGVTSRAAMVAKLLR